MARTRARRMAQTPKPGVEAFAREELEVSAEDPAEAPFPEELATLPSLVEPPKPTRSPPMLLLVVDEEEEEAEFCAPEAANDTAPVESEAAESEPPFDPPDLEDLFDTEPAEDDAETLELSDLLAEDGQDDEEPPFDPMDAEELTTPTLSAPIAAPEELLLTSANDHGRSAALGPARSPVPDSAREQPAPAIRIHLSWDRPAAADFFARVAADPRLSRTEITIARGGLDGAAVRCAAPQRPDLVVIDTTLRGAPMLASLDRLMHAAGRETKVIVLGAVNDVTLLRELAQRGVDEYMIWPVQPEDVAGAACAMFAGADKARVFAVIGARGGIGASTIAHNLAWSIAERQRARVTLVDLDLAFGAAAFNFKLEPLRSLGDVLDAGEGVNDLALEEIGIQHTERLTILPAPASARCAADLHADTAQALVAAARRLSTYVVLDIPHMWDPWIKQALLGADEIVLVSCPDIASLRNTDNIAKRIKDEQEIDPIVVLSMVGVPKRPEVPLKEFAEALGLTPACAFSFEPNIFGASSLTGQMLSEIAPGSKAAAQFDQLATLLTGREPVEVLRTEPRIFAEPDKPALASAPHEPADPFEHALVNPIALLAPEEMEEPEAEPAPLELAPLELLEHAVLEPDYIARARAVALDELHAIESQRRPQRRVSVGPAASIAAGFAITALAVGAYLFMQVKAAPAPAQASASVAVQAPAPLPAPPTPQQMAADYQAVAAQLDQGALEQALPRLRHLADAGFAMAQYRLAKLYERGEGVAADLVQARQWTERAAAGGNTRAIYDLGVYYARGEGAPRDDAAAFRYFQQAAELGLADGQYNLGVLYQEGRGAGADPGEALFWFMAAAQQGDAAAAERVAALRRELTPFDVEQAQARLAAFQATPSDPIANGVFAPPPPPAAPVNSEAPQVPQGPPPSHAVGTLQTVIAADQTPR